MKRKIKQAFSRIRRPFVLLFLPTVLILTALIVRENWPGLPQGVNRKSWLTAGDFSIVAYTCLLYTSLRQAVTDAGYTVTEIR